MRAAARSKATPGRRKRPAPAGAESGLRPLKIGEAARALGVEAYVLRFWETQFPFLRPRHPASSHRQYHPKDLESLRLVKRLLHVEGYTIAGAKKHIREVGLEQLCAAAVPAPNAIITPGRGDLQNALAAIRTELVALHKKLDN